MGINAQKRLSNGSNLGDEINRKGIVNIFLRAIYLWDDRFTLILNGGDKPVTIEDIPFEEIEASNAEFECSLLVADVPPRRGKFRDSNPSHMRGIFHAPLPLLFPTELISLTLHSNSAWLCFGCIPFVSTTQKHTLA